MLGKFAEETGVKRKLIEWSLGVGRDVSKRRQAGESLPAGLALKNRIADRLVFSKVKARLGGRLRGALSGGAPLAPEISEFFHALDVLIVEAYGLTECTSGATANSPAHYRFGTVGPALPGTELRLEEDGELLVRSPTVFLGYYKDPEATAAVLDRDGWLRTGDIAEIDADGFVKITDRKKDILITAGGKNVAPQNLENELKTSRWISQALVVGDRRPYVAALVTLDEPEIAKWAADNGIADTDPASLAADERVIALVQEIVDGANRDRSRYEQIKRFAILPRDFSMDAGRGHADAEAQAPRRPGSLRGRDRAPVRHGLARLREAVHRREQLLRALGRQLVVPGRDRPGDAVVDVVVEELEGEALEGGSNGADLRQHVDAVTVVLDHPLDASHLPLDPVQPLHHRGLVVAVLHHATS